MDYLEGAVRKDGDLIRRLHNEPRMANLFERGNSKFSLDNLRDSVTDKGYYFPRVSLYKEWCQNEPIAEPWVAEVCDCDSRTTCFCADLIRYAQPRGWKRGFATFEYWYDSKSLGKGHKRLDGYHATPGTWCVTDDGRDFELVITQPKTLREREDGSEYVQPATFNTIEEEIRFWVFMVGKV